MFWCSLEMVLFPMAFGDWFAMFPEKEKIFEEVTPMWRSAADAAQRLTEVAQIPLTSSFHFFL